MTGNVMNLYHNPNGMETLRAHPSISMLHILVLIQAFTDSRFQSFFRIVTLYSISKYL